MKTSSWEGYSSAHKWTPAQLTTNGVTLREAAQKAGIHITFGFEKTWLDDAPFARGTVREAIGQRLLRLGFKPVKDEKGKA